MIDVFIMHDEKLAYMSIIDNVIKIGAYTITKDYELLHIDYNGEIDEDWNYGNLEAAIQHCLERHCAKSLSDL